MKIFFIIFIPLFILLVPIKLTLYFSYINSQISLRVYKFKLLPRDKDKRSKKQKKKSKKNIKVKDSKWKAKRNNFIKDLKNPSFIKLLLNRLYYRSFKPKCTFHSTLDYSLGDAQRTALSYGGVSIIFPPLYNLLKIVFKFKKSKFLVNPIFEDRFILNYDLKCIIRISLGQIIYAILVILKAIYITKRRKSK